MGYAAEDIIKTLKQAREVKGLSQRALGARAGVPQSHVSKIESGGTDIRLSSLIELSRALDLELKLVPRKAVPAVETVVRSAAPALTTPSPTDAAKALREFTRTLENLKNVRAFYPDLSSLKQIQDSLQAIKNLQSSGRDFGTLFADVRKSYEPLQSQLEQLRKVGAGINALPSLPPETLRSFTQAADSLRQLSNQIAHGFPAGALPRPKYHLDEDGEDVHD